MLGLGSGLGSGCGFGFRGIVRVGVGVGVGVRVGVRVWVRIRVSVRVYTLFMPRSKQRSYFSHANEQGRYTLCMPRFISNDPT